MEKPNIVLIVMDAVRAQNMSVYGYKKETTPMIEKMLSDCMLYKNAISSAYWTLPSFPSLFTGTYLSKHGLVVEGDVLDPKLITIAEMLKTKGYVTIGLCKNVYVSHFSGLDRGFDIFYDYRYQSPKSMLYDLLLRSIQRGRHTPLHGTKNAGEMDQDERFQGAARSKKRTLENITELGVLRQAFWNLTAFSDKSAKNKNELAFRLVKKVKRKPFFVFIHYDEAHTPYILPKDSRERFIDFELDRKPWDVNQDYVKYFSRRVKMDESDFQTLEALYNGAISYLDRRVHEIYSFLQEENLSDNTMMIITSDHGDNLGEHGIMFHVFCLYDTLIKIPLIIKYPAELSPSGSESRIVQNTDVLPTIMDVLGVKGKNMLNQIQGNSLVTSNIKKRSYLYGISELVKPFGPALRPLRKLLKMYDRRLISIRTKTRKYIFSSDGRHEFYDLEKDPQELNNLIDRKDKSIRHDILDLRRKLRPWLEAFNDFYQKNQSKIDEEEKIKDMETEIKQRLKRLGYLCL